MRPQPLTPLVLDAIQNTAMLSETYVFPDASGGMMSYKAKLKRLHRLSRTWSCRCTVSTQVRHWTGSVATAMGKSKKAVAQFPGHQDTHATERYMHALEPEKSDVARQVETELREAIKPTEETGSACG